MRQSPPAQEGRRIRIGRESYFTVITDTLSLSLCLLLSFSFLRALFTGQPPPRSQVGAELSCGFASAGHCIFHVFDRRTVNIVCSDLGTPHYRSEPSPAGAASLREFKDVVFEDLVFGNDSSVTPYQVNYDHRIR